MPENLISPIRVLIVEDNLHTVEHIRSIVRKVSSVSDIAVAKTEREALGQTAEHGFDVLVVDLHLAEGSGFGLLRELKARGSKAFSIVMTNYTLPPYKAYAHLLGAQYFLDKSTDMEALPHILETLSANLAGNEPHV